MENSLMPEASGDSLSAASQEEVVKQFLDIVKDGGVNQFIIIGVDNNNQSILATYYNNVLEGLGLLDIGKHVILNGIGGDE
jgi:hypothetical protein